MKSVPEFSRPLPVDRVPPGGSVEKVVAEPAERDALANRLGVECVHTLSAVLEAMPWRGGGLKVKGTLVADLDRVSVVSLEPFRARVEYPVERYFLPAAALAETGDDTADPIAGGEIDLGEIVAETLALELDPYPRRPGEVFAAADDTEGDARASPFGVLKSLKKD
jgi:uncharacterized metal-binding protein YceD (DUF177 family)